jgi:hypothetical protein
MEAMMEQQLAAEANARSQAASAAAKGEVDKYAALIKATVERYMILDPTMRGKTCTIGVKLASSGFVISVDNGQGDPAVCRSGKAAVLKANQLPVPKDPAAFEMMKEFNLSWRQDLKSVSALVGSILLIENESQIGTESLSHDKKSVFCFGWLFLLGQSAQAALDIVITGGIDSARPIAIAPFKWEGNGQLPQDIAEVVSNDLMRSGKFKPLARGQMPQTPSTSGEINFAPWASQGEAVVVSSIAAVGDGTYKINFELVDVLKGQLAKTQGGEANGYILDSRMATIPGAQMRQFAHRISDIVYERLTGERGAFLTRLAYVSVQQGTQFPYQLRISDYDGYNEKTLLRSREPLMSPAWSPDGSKLAT